MLPTSMQTDPLNLVSILEHAARFHGRVQVVTRRVEDDTIHRYTYADALRRTKRLANGLRGLGIQLGDRVATLGWNTYRHLEAWYAIAGQGAICHTVNPRLFQPQIEYILNHAADSVVMVDPPFVPLLESLQDSLPAVRHFIVMTEAAHMPTTTLRNALCYETLLAGQSDEFDWPEFSEEMPSSLCYTSGTTGDPKGVLYTHRSNVLHAYCANGSDILGVGGGDTVLMVVPMFHANSWGLAYSCPMAGAKLVLPGARLDGESIFELLESERVTFSAAVPTVWNMLLGALKGSGRQLPYLNEVMIGGSAVPRRMIEIFDREYQVRVVHGWGMTETSPLGTVCRLKGYMHDYDYARQVDVRLKQGPPAFGVSMKIVDDQGQALPHDGQTFGRLLVKGPWVVKRYYRATEDAVDAEGWFDTGDVATIDDHGYMQITDRAKDLIKSGGEWISSVDMENAAMSHPGVAMAAVIGVPHPKWEERPLLIVKAAEGDGLGTDLTCQTMIDFLATKVVRWWLPDDVVFVPDIPLTAAGKISKKTLREQFRDYRWPSKDAHGRPFESSL